MSTQVSSAEDFLNLSQILLLKSKFEKIICVVDLLLSKLALSVECEHLVLHEKCHIHRLVDGFKSARSWLGRRSYLAAEHVLDMSRC
jgi:hypothetical protein